jgi:hypothetical protein
MESARNSLIAQHEREVNALHTAHRETLAGEQKAAAAVQAELEAKLQRGSEALSTLSTESSQTIRGTISMSVFLYCFKALVVWSVVVALSRNLVNDLLLPTARKIAS